MQLSRLSLIGLVSAVTAFSVTVSAQMDATNVGAKLSLSLEDCIRMALKDNLTLEVGDRIAIGETADVDIRSGGRLGVEEMAQQVEAAFGYYDPIFRASGGQRYQRQAPRFEEILGQVVSPGTRWNEDFSVGLTGYTPIGTRYELSASLNRLSGTRLDTDDTTPSPTFGQFIDMGWQYSSDARIRITQPLLRDLWIDAGRLNIKLRRQDLKISEHAFRLLAMDILQRVALAYYDLIAAKDQVVTRGKALELATQLVTENRKKAEVGTIAPLDVRQSESREATARADLTASRFAVDQAENLLKALITHDFAMAQRMTIEPAETLVPVYQAFSLADAWRNGLENRPDYLLEKEVVERRRIELVYRKNQLFPALDLVGTYGRNGLGESTMDSLDSIADNRIPYYGGAAVLSFPLTFKADRADYRRTKVQQKAAILSLKRREDIVLQEIDTAVKEVKSAYQKTESTREARKFAEEALDAETKQFEVGRTTSFQVLQFQKDLTDARAAEIQAAADYNKALHQLYFREGTTMQRNKVELQIR
jgi:outer membrane protein TolC